MTVIYATLILGAFLVAGVAYEWFFEGFLRQLAEGNDEPSGARPRTYLRCKLDLRGLAMRACPRCRALIGFEFSMDELGLNSDEVADIESKERELRKKRRRPESAHRHEPGISKHGKA